MARHDILEAGFSRLDETINFGMRAIGDNTNLYEIVTIAVIRSSETNKDSEQVKIISHCQGERIFFSIDKILRIIKDKNITEEIGFCEFDYIIDTFCVSSCGKFMLICTQDGKITIRTLSCNDEEETSENNDKLPMVFEEKLDDDYIGECYKGSFFHDGTFYIVTCKGLVKKIVLVEDNSDGLFKSEIIMDLNTVINICAFEYPYLCLEGRKLSILNVNNKSCLSDKAIGIQHLHALESYFYAQDNMGNIYRIYPNEGLIFCLNQKYMEVVDHFHDLLFIGNGEKKNEVNFHGVKKGQKEIELMTYPGPNMVYSIEIQGPVHLLTAEEDVLFFTEIRNNNILSEIRLQIIIKADPDFRLKKLLMKQLFDEAELFAKTFNISPEIIAKAKAENIVSKMVSTSKDIDQLLGLLETIDDPLFRLNCCDAVNCDDGIDTRRVLCYGAFMDISIKDCNKNKENILLVKKMSFNDKLHRFDTFIQMYEKYDHTKWKYFVDCDLVTETKVLLQEGEIDKATRIFSRLDRNTIEELTALKIEKIVSMLNRDFLTKTAFLHTFIPISLKYVPDSIGVFVKWLHNRVLLMEKQSDFPDCAIKFVEKVTNLVDLSASVRPYVHVEDLQDPTCLLKSLKDLKMFLHNFGIRFTLSEYLNNPFIVIRTLLHGNSDIANFSVLMSDFLCPFVFKNNLDMDLLLIEEIKNLLEYEEEYWVNMVPVLLKFIASIDKKLDLAYTILEITDIPWSKGVKDIAQIICQLAPRNPIAIRITEYMNNEQILIILRKYNIHKTQFEKLDDKIFVFKRMIHLNKPSLFEDIHNLCMNDDVRQEADLLIINNLILKQSYDKAMNILDKNKPDKIIDLSKQILERCLQFATSYNLSKKYRDTYFTVLTLIWNRLTKHTASLSDIRKFEFDYKIASAIYGISEYFKMQIQCSDIIQSRKKNALLETLVQEITDSCSTDDIADFETFTLKCKKLAYFFNIKVEEVFLKCLVNGKPFNQFLRLGQYLLDTSKCSKVLSCWALCLLKYVNNSIIDDCDKSLSDVISTVSKKSEDCLVEIQLATKITIKAMVNATDEDHLAVMEVMRWIDSCFYLTEQSNTLNMDTLQIYRYNNALSHSIRESIETIKLSFNIYCATLGSLPNPSTNYLTYFTTNLTLSKDELNKEMECLTSNIRNLLKEGQLLTCFNLIKTIQEGYLCNSTMSKDTLSILQSRMQINWLPKTIEAVLSHRFVDKTLLFNLMLLCDTSQMRFWNYLQIHKKQPHKLSVLAQVGLELCKFHKNTQGNMDLIKILNLCKWWTRVTDKNINYEFFFKANCEERLEALILARQINSADLPEYCFNFSLDLQKIYLKYLEITLKSWKPEKQMLEEDCHNILKHITNPDSILALIDEVWPTVNYYYYEVFVVLLSIHKKLSSKKNLLFEGYQQLLLFLKTYKRVSSPSRSEIETWFGTFPMKAFIDPLSETRLPLTSIFFSSDIWTIIKPEVNLDTYTDWFKVVPILKQFLNQNDICTYAINSALPAGLSNSAGNTWEFYPKYDHIVAKVEECANNITDLERATAAVYTLMCNMTPGADKVRLAELSYKYVQIYKDTANSDSVEIVYMKVKQRYFNYSAIHILYKYQLAEDEYLKLVAQPQVLISTLYNDPRIPKQINSLHPNCPDINSAVDELCILFNLTTKKIKFGELLKFLESDSTLDVDRDGETDRLLRGYYICKSTDFHKLLLKIGLNKDDKETSSILVRANALKCFYYTSDINSIETMTGMSQEQFLSYLNKVSVMAKLEILGFKLNNINELDQSSKKLLKKLAEIDKPLSIQCVANICKIYEFDDLMYWKFIINSTIKFNLIKDLCDYVEHLRFRCVTDFIQNAWNAIISDSFKTETNYIAALRLLQTCPVIYALNIEEYVKKCISHKRLDIAAVLLQYIPQEKTHSYLPVVLKKERIFEDVAELQNEVLGIDKVLKMLESYNK